MIASIRGVLQHKSANVLVIECGGLGYEILAPLTVTEQLPEEGAEVFLLTEFVVREMSQTLYGFLHERERRLFRQLMKTSGVGAKTVLAMMSTMTIDELMSALAAEDVAKLSLIPGIGKKTADRLVVDFRGNLLLREAVEQPEQNDEVEQVLSALGYKKAEIKNILTQLDADSGTDTATRVRTALRLLSGK